jgi:hypothetical protein
MVEYSLGVESHFYEYLKSIPRREDVPILWPAEHRAQLQGTEVHQLSVDMWAAANYEWQVYVLPLWQEFPDECPETHFSLERYLEMRSVVTSRAFRVDEHHGIGLVPVADMFNHITGGCPLGKVRHVSVS